jgi:hypothetical protein
MPTWITATRDSRRMAAELGGHSGLAMREILDHVLKRPAANMNHGDAEIAQRAHHLADFVRGAPPGSSGGRVRMRTRTPRASAARSIRAPVHGRQAAPCAADLRT